MKKPKEKDVLPQSPAAPRRRIPKWAVITVLLIVVLTLAGLARHYYLGHEEERYVRVARMYLEQGKSAELRLVLEKVLTLNPNNVEAFRIFAQSSLKDGDTRAAIPWLYKAATLAPNSLDDQIALADALLTASPVAGAGGANKEVEKIVRDMDAAGRGRADFQDLAGRFQHSQGKLAEAEKHYAEAVRLAPGNSTYRLHLAVTRLAGGDADAREAARKELAALGDDPAARAVALRALVVDAARSARISAALALAARLDAVPERTFSDRLMYLELLQKQNAPEFHDRLAEAQREAEQKPEYVLPLLYWMNGNNLSLLAREWAERLPGEKTAALGVRVEIARSYAAFGEWKKLRYFLADEKWEEFNYLRLAYLARCNRELEVSTTASQNSWMEAVNVAASNGDALLTLARMAFEWGWDGEATDALWQAVSKSNRSREALASLERFYFAKRNTDGLYRVYSLLLDRNPGDPNVRNNFAIFCLLLDKKKDYAVNVARELREKEPANSVYASTYALALLCTGQAQQALEVMQALKPAALKEPSLAAYYSGVLAAVGRNEEAAKYRALARTAKLLPEEAQILHIPVEEEAPALEAAPQVTIPSEINMAEFFPAPPPAATPAPAASEPAATPAAAPSPAASEPAATPAS